MSNQPLPECSIERFAEFSALLDEGRAPRTSILEAASMDETVWAHLTRHWLARLSTGDDADVAARFGIMYARTRCALASLARAKAPSQAEQNEGSAVEQSSGPAPSSDVDDTLRDAVDPAAPAGPSAAPDSGTELTLECAPDAGVRRALPFVPPPPPLGAAPPGKRWAYFDTQTGHPLPAPVLIDVPEEPQQ